MNRTLSAIIFLIATIVTLSIQPIYSQQTPDRVFAVIGDTDNEDEWEIVSNMLCNHNPKVSITLGTGDYAYSTTKSTIQNWYDDASCLHDQPGEIMYLAPGNHDDDRSDYTDVTGQQSFNFDIIDDTARMQYVIIDAMELLSLTDIQAQDFANNIGSMIEAKPAGYDTAFVIHHPLHITDPAHHPVSEDPEINQYLSPIVAAYNVSLVFQGHNHVSEISKALEYNVNNNNYALASQGYIDDNNGTVIHTQGTGGRSLHTEQAETLHSLNQYQSDDHYGAAIYEVYPDKWKVLVKSMDGQVRYQNEIPRPIYIGMNTTEPEPTPGNNTCECGGNVTQAEIEELESNIQVIEEIMGQLVITKQNLDNELVDLGTDISSLQSKVGDMSNIIAMIGMNSTS